MPYFKLPEKWEGHLQYWDPTKKWGARPRPDLPVPTPKPAAKQPQSMLLGNADATSRICFSWINYSRHIDDISK